MKHAVESQWRAWLQTHCMYPVTVAMMLLGAGPVCAQSGGAYAMVKSTVDGGGVTLSVGGSYVLGATIGQPDAGSLAGGSYSLRGGFWYPGGPMPTSVRPDAVPPSSFRLVGSAPNPFTRTTAIRFELPRAEHVSLRIYDIDGGLVSTLVDEDLSPQRYERRWDGTDGSGRRVRPGVYLVKLQSASERAASKILVLE
jgi:flagellar hook capping protein FlgD